MKPQVVKSYVNTSKEIIEKYIQECSAKFIPLNVYLKSFYKKNTKFGKRDRNAISDLVFAFFRLGHTLPLHKIEQRIIAGSYLCNHNAEGIYNVVAESELGELDYEANLHNRIKNIANYFKEFEINNFFPFNIELSKGIEKQQYIETFLKKPSIFIRVLPKFKLKVLTQLNDEGIKFEEIDNHPEAVKIISSKNLQDLDAWKKGYFEIQDLSSQEIGNLFSPAKGDEWWDVCAASGGKSLLLLSKEKDLFISATDVRKSILENYSERVKRLNFLNFETKVLNASLPQNLNRYFDGIICDVPCTGSGTWHRTPENLFFFNENTLKEFTTIQKQILHNSFPFLKHNKNLIYITCSVFYSENEHIIENSGLSPLENSSINNFSSGADAMFYAKFIKA